MTIQFACPQCGNRYRLEATRAGEKMQCTWCSATLRIPAPAAPGGSNIGGKAKSAGPASHPPGSNSAEPHGSDAPTEAVPLPVVRPASGSLPLVVAAPGSPSNTKPPSTIKPSATKGGRASPHKSRKPRRKRYALAVVGGGLLLAGAVVVALIASNNSQQPPAKDSPIAGSGEKTSAKTATATSGKSPAKPQIVLNWPEAERSGAAIFLDRQKHVVPPTGAIEFTLAPGKHHLIIVRRGYDQIEEEVDLSTGGPRTITPKFAPLWASSLADLRKTDSLRSGAEAPPKPAAPATTTTAKAGGNTARSQAFDKWPQDFEAARTTAAAEKKDILVLFDGSDWCGYSIRMTDTVFAKAGFGEQAAKDFICVFVDFPKSPTAKKKVADPARNRQLSDRFNVSGYPTIILTDATGRPYAVDGYQRSDVTKFLARMRKWKEVRVERDRLFAAIEQAEGEAKLTPAAEALELFESMELSSHYDRELSDWSRLAEQHDPDNKKGLAEVFFAASWTVRAQQVASRGPQRLAQVTEELDAWTKKREFKNPDRGAELYLTAAWWMMTLEQVDLAARYIDRGIAFKPANKAVSQALAKGRLAIQSAREENVLAAGSGFVVAAGGYVVTNYHLLEGSTKILVKFPAQRKSVPAKLIAHDAEANIALLKVDNAATSAPPISVMETELGRGASVEALGYPLNDVAGEAIEFKESVVSASHTSTPSGRMMLDCKLNPGNSGGPVCTPEGCAAGMLTSKVQGAGLEATGMAVPGETLVAFLKKNLPGYAPPKSPAASAAWDAVNKRVSPSVVLILKGRAASS